MGTGQLSKQVREWLSRVLCRTFAAGRHSSRAVEDGVEDSDVCAGGGDGDAGGGGQDSGGGGVGGGSGGSREKTAQVEAVETTAAVAMTVEVAAAEVAPKTSAGALATTAVAAEVIAKEARWRRRQRIESGAVNMLAMAMETTAEAEMTVEAIEAAVEAAQMTAEAAA